MQERGVTADGRFTSRFHQKPNSIYIYIYLYTYIALILSKKMDSISFIFRIVEQNVPSKECHFASCHVARGEQHQPGSHLNQLDEQVTFAYPQLINQPFYYVIQGNQSMT